MRSSKAEVKCNFVLFIHLASIHRASTVDQSFVTGCVLASMPHHHFSHTSALRAPLHEPEGKLDHDIRLNNGCASSYTASQPHTGPTGQTTLREFFSPALLILSTRILTWKSYEDSLHKNVKMLQRSFLMMLWLWQKDWLSMTRY